MFGWMKGRRAQEQEFLDRALRAMTEGNARARVNRALGTLGADVPPEPKNVDFCVSAATSFMNELARAAGLDCSSLDDDEAFVLGLFSMVASDHLCHIVGAQFEMASVGAHIMVFGPDRAESFPSLIDSYNTMATRGDMIQVIGNAIAKWFGEPSTENFARLSKLLSVCLESSKRG